MTTNHTTPPSPIPATPTPTLIQRYVGLMYRLMQLVAERYLRDRTEANMSRMIDGQSRLEDLSRRLRDLLTRIEAGTLPRFRLRDNAPGKPRNTADSEPVPSQRALRETPRRKPAMSRKFGWLIREGGPNHHEVIHTRDRIGDLLNEPETLAKLATVPRQAGRIVRPLCHMLMLATPEPLRLPVRPRPPRTPKPRAKRPVWVMPFGTPRVASAHWPKGCVSRGETVPLRKRNRRRLHRLE